MNRGLQTDVRRWRRRAAPWVVFVAMNLSISAAHSASGARDASTPADTSTTSSGVAGSGGRITSGTVFVPQATIRWKTESEENTYGFYVERADTPAGPFRRLNERIIAGHGTTDVPHAYEFVDTQVEAGKSYWYRLWSLSYQGERKLLQEREHKVKTADEARAPKSSK